MTTYPYVVPTIFAPLQNLALMQMLTNELIARPPHIPGFGVYYGPSGFGKSFASIYTQNKTGACLIELFDSWTKKKLLTTILSEFGVRNARGTISDLADQAVLHLGENSSQPLIIDQADVLIEKKMIEIVRELQARSGAPIILIGEENFPSNLAQYERTHNRVFKFVAAVPCDLEDTKHLYKNYCPDIELSEGLLEKVRKDTHGRARRISTTLVSMQKFALANGLTSLTEETYTDRIVTGAIPARRRVG